MSRHVLFLVAGGSAYTLYILKVATYKLARQPIDQTQSRHQRPSPHHPGTIASIVDEDGPYPSKWMLGYFASMVVDRLDVVMPPVSSLDKTDPNWP